MTRVRLLPVLALAALSGCTPGTSLDSYRGTPDHLAGQPDQGVIVCVRKVIPGGSAIVAVVARTWEGVATPSGPGTRQVTTPLGLPTSNASGAAGQPAGKDIAVFEYIVRRQGTDLVSVMQQDQAPLAVGGTVLILGGDHARIVADQTATRIEPAIASPERIAGARIAQPAATVRLVPDQG